MNLKNNFSLQAAKKILGNKINAELFLFELQKKKGFKLPIKVVSRGINKGNKVLDLNTNDLWATVIRHWDFSVAEKIIRGIFTKTNKYQNGKRAYITMNALFEEWSSLNLGDINWPFSQGNFDGFVQTINSESTSGCDKDEKVKCAAIKYRRIKEFNTVRNDFIETLIFEKNENILPTLGHKRGVDFFIDGVSFDQKVARTPTKQFKKDFGDDWKKIAINNPSIVARYLYKYQDEGRFGADNRLLVVYLDEGISIERISEIIEGTDLDTPLEVCFDYIHNQGKPTEKIESYKVNCFVILLSN